MVQTLADVQPPALIDVHPLQLGVEIAVVRLVAPHLLGSDDGVERHFQDLGGLSEQVVVHIGDYRQLVVGLHRPERGDGVREDRPRRQSIRKAGQVGLGELELERDAYQGHHSSQDTPILKVPGAVLDLRLDLGEELEYLRPGQANVVRAQRGVYGVGNAGLPVDQRAVTVEAQPFEVLEIKQ